MKLDKKKLIYIFKYAIDAIAESIPFTSVNVISIDLILFNLHSLSKYVFKLFESESGIILSLVLTVNPVFSVSTPCVNTI